MNKKVYIIILIMLFINSPAIYFVQAGEGTEGKGAVSIQSAAVIVRVVAKSQGDANILNIKKETSKKNEITSMLKKIKEKFIFMNILK